MSECKGKRGDALKKCRAKAYEKLKLRHPKFKKGDTILVNKSNTKINTSLVNKKNAAAVALLAKKKGIKKNYVGGTTGTVNPKSTKATSQTTKRKKALLKKNRKKATTKFVYSALYSKKDLESIANVRKMTAVEKRKMKAKAVAAAKKKTEAAAAVKKKAAAAVAAKKKAEAKKKADKIRLQRIKDSRKRGLDRNAKN